MQKCQVSFERKRDADSKVVELEAEKKGLQAALDAKDERLQEEVRKNADLAADFEDETAEVDRRHGEVDKQARLAVDLITTMNRLRAEHKSALEAQKAESEFALERQKAELERKF